MEFDEEVFLTFYGDKLKKYMKDQISQKMVKNNVFEFDICDFLKNYSDSCDINDQIIENPKLVEDPLLYIFKDAYMELFGEDEHIKKELEKTQIAFKNPLGCDKKIDEITSSE